MKYIRIKISRESRNLYRRESPHVCEPWYWCYERFGRPTHGGRWTTNSDRDFYFENSEDAMFFALAWGYGDD